MSDLRSEKEEWEFFDAECLSVDPSTRKTPTHLTFLFTLDFLNRCWSARISVPSWMITDAVFVKACLMKASGSMAMTSCCHTCLPLVMIKGRVWRRTWMSLNYAERDSPIILCILVKNRHLYSIHTGHGMPQHCLHKKK